MHENPQLNLEELDRALERVRVVPRDPDITARQDQTQWNALSRRLGLGDGATSIRRRKASPQWIRNLVWIIPVFGVVVWQTLKPKATNSGITTYTTRSGQLASLALKDGSRLILGPATTLHVLTASSGTSVEITGEALFNVAHTANRSFTIKAHGVTTRVLGTEFVVRAYDASSVRIAVRDGRVSVQSPVTTSANAAIVSAGEAASATGNTAPVIEPIADLAAEFSWSSGELVLRNVPLGEALVRLSRWYGMEFNVKDPSLLHESISATFPSGYKQSSIGDLAIVLKADVIRVGNTITFARKER